MLEILYEDNHIIAVNKQPSDIVQADKTGDEPLSEKVKKYIKKKYNKPGAVFLGVVHRIDRPVSGVIIFAKTSKALSRLNTLFREKKIKKTYLAIVKNKPSPTKNTLIHYLKKNKLKNKTSAFKKSIEGSLKSELEYELIKSLDNYYLLKITPKTGRHHQIRVQLSTIGCPIKGDLKYGAKRSNKNASINLHAYKVEFTHPVKKNNIIISAKPPKENIWNNYN